jgi:hypothetical protein
MRKNLILALVIAISLGGMIVAMAADDDENQVDSQNSDEKGINCEKLCEGSVCNCTDPDAEVIPCDTNDDGKDDCWCEVGLTTPTCLLPLEGMTE